MRSKKQVMGGESGRSMLETLGVLAMMGLLVIGGIAGYRYAVDKYRLNELWNNVKWISVQVMTDGSFQGMSSGDETTVKSFSGDSDLILKRETANGYSVRVGNLRESTCRQIRRDKPDWVEEVVSNEGAGCQDGEENEVKIYFNGQLNSETTDEGRYKRCEGDEECGACGRCSDGKKCHWDCPTGQFGAGSTYYSCDDPEMTRYPSTPETCRQCAGIRFYDGKGNCTRCDVTGVARWAVLKEDCLLCPQRYWTGGQCFLCPEKDSAEWQALNSVFQEQCSD